LDWNLELTRFTTRTVYLALMDNRLRSTDDQQAVHLDFPHPDADHELSRALLPVSGCWPFPHYIVLLVLTIGAFFATICVWFAILFTGRYPRSLFDYIEGPIRWQTAPRFTPSCSSPTATPLQPPAVARSCVLVTVPLPP
jgi:Domain of unknown function (DUF4389)